MVYGLWFSISKPKKRNLTNNGLPIPNVVAVLIFFIFLGLFALFLPPANIHLHLSFSTTVSGKWDILGIYNQQIKN